MTVNCQFQNTGRYRAFPSSISNLRFEIFRFVDCRQQFDHSVCVNRPLTLCVFHAFQRCCFSANSTQTPQSTRGLVWRIGNMTMLPEFNTYADPLRSA